MPTSPADFPRETEAERLAAEQRRYNILIAEADTYPDDKRLQNELEITKKKLSGQISPFNTRDPEHRPPSMASINDGSPEQLAGPGMEDSVVDKRPQATTATFDLGTNTNLFTQSFAAANSAIDTASKTISGMGETFLANSKKIVDALLEKADVDASVNTQNKALLLKKESKASTIEAAFGLDPSVAGNIIASSAAAAHSLSMQHATALDRYSKLNETSIFSDGPLAWLTAQMAIPKAAAVVNDLSAKHAGVVNTLEAATKLSTETINNSKLAAATTTQKLAEQESRSIQLQGIATAYRTGDLSLEQAKSAVTSVMTMALEKTKLFEGALRQNEQYRENNFRDWMKFQAMDDAAQKKAEHAEIIASADKTAATFSAMTGTQVSRNTMPKTKEAAIIGGGSWGADIPTAITNVSKYLNPNSTNPNVQGTRVLATRIEQEFTGAIRTINTMERDKAIKSDMLTRYRDAGNATVHKFEEMEKDVFSGENNPYKGGTMASYLRMDAGLVSKIPLLTSSLKPLIDSNQIITPQAILDTINKLATTSADGKTQIADGRILGQAARELDTYYQAVVKNNNETYHYGSLNVPMQTSYKTMVTLPNGKKVPIDLNVPGQAMSVLLQMSVAANDKAKQGRSEFDNAIQENRGMNPALSPRSSLDLNPISSANAAEGDKYIVINTKTGQAVSGPQSTLARATNILDKKDNEYGGYAHKIITIPAGSN